MSTGLFAAVAAAIAAGGLSTAETGEGWLRLPCEDVPVYLQIELQGAQPEWALQRSDAHSRVYASAEHLLECTSRRTRGQIIVEFKLARKDGEPAVVPSYTCRAAVPLDGLHAVMVPATRPIGRQLEYYHETRKWRENVPVHRCKVSESFQEEAVVNNEAPFVLLSDDQGDNRIAIGWTAAETAATLAGERSDAAYLLTLKRANDIPFQGKTVEDALFISTSRQPWMQVERAYARSYDRYNKIKHDPIPKWAYEPVFCTWYCYSENIDQELMLKISRKCKEIGFGTILIDAGWDKKPGEWWGDLDKGGIGDYAASPELFPDLPGMVKQIQDMGLRVELWASPFWQARGSRSYLETTRTWMVRSGEADDYYLCPKHPGTREYLRDAFARLARTYGIDGMWLDVCDGVPPVCKADHEHLDQPMGQAWVDCMAAMREGLRSVRADAITEARILHANLNSKRALDVVQCGDSPKSFEMIRLALLHLRPWAYDIVVKNDPMIWPPGSDAATVGKFLETMVVSGVPSLSVDFLTEPETHCRMTASWLEFYRKHSSTLLQGDLALFGADPDVPDMMLTGRDEAVVYIRNSRTRFVKLPHPIKKVYVLNCSDSDQLHLQITPASGAWKAVAHNPDWTKVGPAVPLVAAGELLPPSAPQGGFSVLEMN